MVSMVKKTKNLLTLSGVLILGFLIILSIIGILYGIQQTTFIISEQGFSNFDIDLSSNWDIKVFGRTDGTNVDMSLINNELGGIELQTKNVWNEPPGRILAMSKNVVDGSDGRMFYGSSSGPTLSPPPTPRTIVGGFKIGFTCGNIMPNSVLPDTEWDKRKTVIPCPISALGSYCEWSSGNLNPNELYVNQRLVNSDCRDNHLVFYQDGNHISDKVTIKQILVRKQLSCRLREGEFWAVETLSGEALTSLDHFDTRYAVSGYCPTTPVIFTKKIINEETGQTELGVDFEYDLYDRLNSGETINLKELGVESVIIQYKFLNEKPDGSHIFEIPCMWETELLDANTNKCTSRSGTVLVAGKGSVVDVPNSQIISTPEPFESCPEDTITKRLENGTLICEKFLPIRQICESGTLELGEDGNYFCEAPIFTECPLSMKKVIDLDGNFKCVGEVTTTIIGIDWRLFSGIIALGLIGFALVLVGGGLLIKRK